MFIYSNNCYFCVLILVQFLKYVCIDLFLLKEKSLINEKLKYDVLIGAGQSLVLLMTRGTRYCACERFMMQHKRGIQKPWSSPALISAHHVTCWLPGSEVSDRAADPRSDCSPINNQIKTHSIKSHKS